MRTMRLSGTKSRVLAAMCATVTLTCAVGVCGDHPEPSKPDVLTEFGKEAEALRPLIKSDAAWKFCCAAHELPAVKTRVLYYERETRKAWTEDEARKEFRTSEGAVDEEKLASLRKIEADTRFYYTTSYGTPLAYVRALDLAAENGFAIRPGARVMDFGYGSIGQLRMLASLGCNVVGVEVSELLNKLYSAPGDTGDVPMCAAVSESKDEGHVSAYKPFYVSLAHGQWPAEENVREAVGGGFDLITSKNTLKRGYIHPEREVDPRMLVHLGVDDEEFLRRVHGALKPGGLFVIYNLSPAPAPPDKPYIPWADGRCPFDQELVKKTGFEIVAFDVDDSAFARKMGAALGWGESMELESDLFGHYTILRRGR